MARTLLLPLLYLLTKHCFCICNNTSSCLLRLKKIAAEPRRFWFGEQWRDRCTGRYISHIECYNPQTLQSFHSLGSRLFRVNTYQNEYLKNLHIFPTISYPSLEGSQKYRACDHEFTVRGTEKEIEVNPDMDPVNPYAIRHPPKIQWDGRKNGSYIIIATDVGFGTLNFFTLRLSAGDKVVKEYAEVENFRDQANPVVFLIFEAAGVKKHFNFDTENFNLPKFMLDSNLENALIGMNILLVSTDPYAIEKQRIRGAVDNCPSLIIKKVENENQWHILKQLPLRQISNWVSVHFEQVKSQIQLCCREFSFKKEIIRTDPLGNKPLASVTVRKHPRVTSVKNVQQVATNNPDVVETYKTIVIFDLNNEFLYWMVADLPTLSLFAGNVEDGHTIVPYLPPVPQIPKTCTTAVLLLLTQPPSLISFAVSKYYKNNSLYANCQQNCSQRSQFDIAEFVSLHQLQLFAINWFSICHDVFEAVYHKQRFLQIFAAKHWSRQESNFSALTNSHRRAEAVYKNNRFAKLYNDITEGEDITENLCSEFGLTYDQPCMQKLLSNMVTSKFKKNNEIRYSEYLEEFIPDYEVHDTFPSEAGFGRMVTYLPNWL
ncbi:unnamed protein product [Thelazia callipaeda]|uniref:Cadherin domain-containing protein n=1 Tax=Thelazia callipaeda TaxID=103827 RepID=A0A0N5D221_THECL|nr:unnamed protein product [Thelazia callipaeda]